MPKKIDFNEVDQVTILSPCYVLEVGQEKASPKKVGDVVKVKGNDKVALLGTGKGAITKDLTDEQKEFVAKAKSAKAK